MFLALDGNFRMSRRDISNDERDPSLTQNRGYFVDKAELASGKSEKGHSWPVKYIA